MKKVILHSLLVIVVFVFGGCAATYKNIDPPALNYSAHDLQDGISLSYKHNVLRERGNNKYAKKEDKAGVRLVAIKLTNNTDSVLRVNRDLVFYSDSNQIFPLAPMAIKNSIKQVVPAYLPYLLLTLVNLSITNNNKTQVYPIGLVLGPGIAGGNMAVAGSSNNKMLKELIEYDILSRDIQKGETVYGIIGIFDLGYNPISVKIKK